MDRNNINQTFFKNDGGIIKQEILPKSMNSDSVDCLGISFENETARQEYFRNLFLQKLNNLEYRNIDGFPNGTNNDIVAISDPPYYTACPNPFIVDFINFISNLKDFSNQYDKEPFAVDVSEGKTDEIYKAHGYHTKVPYKAIMKYILYYTRPGDIVLDCFAGTGMTGIAAQMCGYPTQDLKSTIENLWNEQWQTKPDWGIRYSIIGDLSPVASFISYNYNSPIDENKFKKEADLILSKVWEECGWMYETKHIDGKKGHINYTVWSDVFTCPVCAGEIIFFNVLFDNTLKHVLDEFTCPHCNKNKLKKINLDRQFESFYDRELNDTLRRQKQVPVLINYSIKGVKGNFEKKPDDEDILRIKKIEDADIPYWFPLIKMPDGYNTAQPKISHGVTHLHHLYQRNALITLSVVYNEISKSDPSVKPYLIYAFEQAILGMAKISRYSPTHYSQVNRYLNGTLYIGSQIVDVSINYIMDGKISRLYKVLSNIKMLEKKNTIITTQSASSLNNIPSNVIDYIFTDPPFGSNIMYSELNFLWEAWLKIFTNNKTEAIENSAQGKSINDYQRLMEQCFKEYFRVLKPGRWMTVEFSNTQASVWNALQTALEQAGFVVANVSALDKQQGSFKAVTTPTAVKQDLVISCYKPNGGLEERFKKEANTEEGIWDFIRTHLKYLPAYKGNKDIAEFIPERDPRILYDRMVAYFVRHGYDVPLSSPEFQKGLAQRFVERDGMYFLSDQAVEYDKKRMQAKEFGQRYLFVTNEGSAIQWLRDFLKKKPSKYQDIHPEFIQQLGAGWTKYEKKPELYKLLEENFLRYDGLVDVPSQIHGYLSTNFKELRNLSKDDSFLKEKAKDRWYVPDPNKSGDIEKVREKTLLKEFNTMIENKSRIKELRIEVLRAGFKYCWSKKDYRTIVDIAKKVPESIIQEDNTLLMYYENAMIRLGE